MRLTSCSEKDIYFSKKEIYFVLPYYSGYEKGLFTKRAVCNEKGH